MKSYETILNTHIDISKRLDAVENFLKSYSKEKESVMERILRNDYEQNFMKKVVITKLAELNTGEAKEILLRNLTNLDQELQSQVLLVLGRIGDRKCMEYIVGHRTHLEKNKNYQFTLSLFSYRFNIKDYTLKIPPMMVPSASFRHIDIAISRASREEIKDCLRLFRKEAIDFVLSKESGLKLGIKEFGIANYLIVFKSNISNYLFSDQRKDVLGILFAYDHCASMYFMRYFLLAASDKDNINILFCTLDGEIHYMCKGFISNNGLEFNVHASLVDSTIPLYINGEFTKQNITMRKSLISEDFVDFSRNNRLDASQDFLIYKW